MRRLVRALWAAATGAAGLLATATRADAGGVPRLDAPTVEEVRITADAHAGDLPEGSGGVAAGRDACGWPTDACGQPVRRVELTLEGTLSWLDGPEGALGVDTGEPSQIRWSAVDLDPAFGGRGSLAVRVTPYDRLRLRGWWLGGFEGDASGSGVYGYGEPPTTSVVTGYALEDEADLWSASLQWMRELAACGAYRLDAVLGARVLSFDETATASLTTPVGSGGPSGTVSSRAENRFYGGELGAVLEARVGSSWTVTVGGLLLLGVMGRDVTVEDSGLFSAGAKTATESTDDFGWGVEVDIGLTWRFTPRVGLTLGYQFLYLGEVQRANEAMDFGQAGTGQVQARDLAGSAATNTVYAGITVSF